MSDASGDLGVKLMLAILLYALFAAVYLQG